MISLWKYCCSFFFPIKLDEKQSLHSGKLELLLVNGTKQLASENAIYSFGKRYYNYAYSFSKLPIDKFPIKKVLVLGYGLGSVTELLDQYFDELEINGVELDAEIIEWEVEHGFQKNGFQINITQANAIDWINHDNQEYDLIILDIFIDQMVPNEFESFSFLNKLKDKLNHKGLVLFNRLSYTPELKSRTLKVLEIMEEIFPNTSALNIKGNTMIIGSKHPFKRNK